MIVKKIKQWTGDEGIMSLIHFCGELKDAGAIKDFKYDEDECWVEVELNN